MDPLRRPGGRTGRWREALALATVTMASIAACAADDEALPLEGRALVVDAGHGGTAAFDDFRVGPTGEREEWVNLRVALLLEERLRAAGARVLMTRREDVEVPLPDRGRLAVDSAADLFLSIHHNATADPAVNFPIIYFHGEASRNPAGVALARALAEQLTDALFEPGTPYSVVSDFTIFPTAGASVLRSSAGVPGAIVEASFFTNPAEEARLRDPDYNAREADALFAAIVSFFQLDPPPQVLARAPAQAPPPFAVLQEAERMRPEALEWRAQAERAFELISRPEPDSVALAYALCTRSARSFPDSYLAGRCHAVRARAEEAMGRPDDARLNELRVAEYYPLSVAPGRAPQ
jgi:N-acetylmuramoyl-L-alanine amidase